MATKPRNPEARQVFRSVDEIVKHFQPKRAAEHAREENPFASLQQSLTPAAFRRAQAQTEDRSE